ncbi:vacuolar protein sorting-associated protein 16 homolog [Wyeomyia smithii]|uniref:vacuolar protein sorting-associated protein 16 homolog n=1 Tax=Wyeomyia smithii TaxID=174621 RepID=UPI002467C933|nr:vacuolar protein sorting-associated protein 16 homolog [Wyeomyia smithii]
MSLLCNTGDWFTLGHGNSYRKIDLYTMDWPASINLEQMTVHAASYGGPIALVKDFKQFLKLSGTGTTKPMIRIFNCAGKLISSITWDNGNLVCMGWSDAEEFLCVQNDGFVWIYDMFGNFQHKFSMGKDVTEVIEAKIFASNSGTGVAVITASYKIYIVNSIKDPKSRPLSELLTLSKDLTCWELVSKERNTCCLLARDTEVILARHGDSAPLTLVITMKSEFSSIIALSVSFNHRHLALYTNTGVLWLGSADLKNKYCEYATGRSERPQQIMWCCDADPHPDKQAVVVSYPSMVLVVGMTGDSNIYTYDSPTVLIQEMDAVRILTNGYHELIQRVPKCTSNIFGISISEPASFLFEAHRKFQERSHQSDEYLCLIQSRLASAVAECVDAAGQEFDPHTQKSLIRAAYFGKGFLPGYNPEGYIEMCRVLRVLNALRDRNVGMPLTLRQFNYLQPLVILDRLIFRKHYALAIQVAKHLKLPESRILEHWAFHKIVHDKNEEEVARKISEKFLSHQTLERISFANVAKKAQQVGKTKLAITLLELEPRKSLQVPLLLKLGANEKALMAATQSGDTDLIYMVILEMKSTTALAKFQMVIRRFPLAQNLYKKYCQANSLSTLKDIYSQEDDFQSQAELGLREALEISNVEVSIPDISGNYKKAGKLLETEACDEAKKFMKHQKAIDEKYQKRLYGLPLHATIRQLLLLGDLKYAERLKSEFRMPDRRYWWLRVQVLSQQFQWEELERFSKSKKSPIGYEPFVEVCLSQRKVDEAKRYLPRCSEENKLKWYLRAGCYVEAATIAYEQKDIDSLLKIYDYCSNDSALSAKVENLIGQLSSKK